MRACIHAAIILLGTEQEPATSTFHSVNTEIARGFKELQGLQCKSQRNMLKCDSAANSPIHTNTLPLRRPPSQGFFPLSHSILKAIKHNTKASYDCIFYNCVTFFALGSVLKMFRIGQFIWKISVWMSACLWGVKFTVLELFFLISPSFEVSPFTPEVSCAG